MPIPQREKRLRGFPGTIYKQLQPLNTNSKFKEKFKKASLKILINPTDQLKAALVIIQKGVVNVEEIKKSDYLMEMKKKKIGFNAMIQVPTLTLINVVSGKTTTIQLLKMERKNDEIKLKGKLKLLKLTKAFALLGKN